MSEKTIQQALVNLTIDGREVSVPKGTTVYQAARQLGVDIPIFCYHDRMPPFGACRMCLVEVEKAPKLQTACTLEVGEGMVVKTQSGTALQGRKDIIEFLLLNHPLDCPICDRGGECPLQENTLEYGPGLSRFFEEKRKFKKPYPLGPVLMLDRERCIACARCTRFSDLISGDHALEFIDRGFRTEVGTPDGGPAESKYIGNTIMICPVGALTSQVYRFRARPWDNEPTPSTCTLCPVGCSMYLDSRDGEIMRTRSKTNPEVNDIWLCDKGWFGYEFTYHPDRLNYPMIRRNGQLERASWDEALSLIAEKMAEFKPKGKLAALGGNPLTVEENYLFQKLMREGAGVNHLDHRIGMPSIPLDKEGLPPGMEDSLAEIEQVDFAILFGLDLTEDFPVIWLRLRQAINRGASIYYFGNYKPEIAGYFTKTFIHSPGKEIETLKLNLGEINSLMDKGKKGAFLVGQQYLFTSHRKAFLAELIKLRQGKNISLNILEGKGNSLGARFAGMRPDLGPMNQKLEQPGFPFPQLLDKIANEGWDFLYVAGANPAQKIPEEVWKKTRSNLQFLVVQDLFLTETASQADVLLPALTFIEKGGNFINIEGRVQPLLPGKKIPEDLFSDGEIFSKIAAKLNLTLNFDSQFEERLKRKRISLQNEEYLESDFAPNPHENASNTGLKAVFVNVLFDQGVRMKHDVHVRELSKDPYIRLNPKEAAQRHLENHASVYLKAHSKKFPGKIFIDKDIADETLVIPLGFEGALPVYELGVNLLNGLNVEIEKVQ